MSDNKEDIHIKQGLVFREEEEGAFLFDPENGRICYLNELGTSIWKSLPEQKDPADQIEKISLEFPDIQKDRIINDYETFFNNLRELGFLT